MPYPQLHPELAQEANKASDASDPSDPRTPSKRKVGGNQLDDEPAPKRLAGTAIPRHIGGLLSAKAPDQPPSQPASPSPVSPSPVISDDEDETSPAPDEPVAAGLGGKLRAPAAKAGETPDVEIDNNPPLPPGASEPDEYGFRTITKRARGGEPASTRIMGPASIEFDELDIGFRDSANDGSRPGITKAKRGKYLNSSGSAQFSYDKVIAGCDLTLYEPGDLDEELVRKHNLHPKYGLFMADSINESEPPKPYVLGRNPTVFVADNGEVLHTSRSIAATRASDIQKQKLKVALQAAMEAADLTQDDLHDEEHARLIKRRDEKRLKWKKQSDAAQEKETQAQFSSNVNILLQAATESDRPQPTKTRKAKPATSLSPTAHRPATRSQRYDAVRDSLRGSDGAAAPANAAPVDNSEATGLMLLADAAIQDAESAAPAPAHVSDPQPTGSKPVPGQDKPGSGPGPVTGETQQLAIQMPEPVHPNQLRDASDLEHGGRLVKFTSDNPFLPEPLAPQLPQYTPRENGLGVQPPQHYQEPPYQEPPYQEPDREVTLARPDAFAYGERYEETARQNSQPRQARRPSHKSQEDQYAPARPNTEDVACLDPQLFENGKGSAPSQLQAPKPEQMQLSQPPQSGGVLQQPQTSFFQTALNSPGVSPPQEHHQQPDYPVPPQVHQQLGMPVGASSRPPPASEDSLGRTPFSHPNGAEPQPLPTLRPLHRGSGSLMAPAPQAPGPQHFTMPRGSLDDYPPQPPAAQYRNQGGYQSNGFAQQEQGPRSGGYMAQPVMQPSLQPPPPPYPQYQPSGHMGPQPPPMYEYAGPTGQLVQSPPPFGNSPGGPPSPSLRGASTPSSTRNKNNQYRDIQPAPRTTETEVPTNGTELRMLNYVPSEGIRDYQATEVPPSHGPTQIRGWTHTTGSKRSRGKNSTDSQIDPQLGQGERK